MTWQPHSVKVLLIVDCDVCDILPLVQLLCSKAELTATLDTLAKGSPVPSAARALTWPLRWVWHLRSCLTKVFRSKTAVVFGVCLPGVSLRSGQNLIVLGV